MHSLVPEQPLTLKIYTNTMPRGENRLRRQFVSPFFAGKSSLKRRTLALGGLFEKRRKRLRNAYEESNAFLSPNGKSA